MTARGEDPWQMKRHHVIMLLLACFCCWDNVASAFIIPCPMIVATTTTTKTSTKIFLSHENTRIYYHQCEFTKDLGRSNIFQQDMFGFGRRSITPLHSNDLDREVSAACMTTAGDDILSNDRCDGDDPASDFLFSSSEMEHQKTKRSVLVGRRRYLSRYGTLCFATLLTSLSLGTISTPAYATERIMSRTAAISDPALTSNMITSSSSIQDYSRLFPTLEYPFQHSALVGLYFAASWCPMSTVPTQQLDTYYGNILLKPPRKLRLCNESKSDTSGCPFPPKPFSQQQPKQQAKKSARLAPLSIVYASSDKTLKEWKLFCRQHKNWFAVPFEDGSNSSTPRGDGEGKAMKQYFDVCSNREMSSLGITKEMRYSEIPCLIIFDSATQSIVTKTGINDLQAYGEMAIQHWIDLCTGKKEKG